MNILNDLRQLEEKITKGEIGKASSPWNNYSVIVENVLNFIVILSIKLFAQRSMHWKSHGCLNNFMRFLKMHLRT